MPCYRFVQTVLDMGEPGSDPTTGQIWRVLPSPADEVTEPAQQFLVFVEVALTGGQSKDPRVDVLLETSPDGEVWFPAVRFRRPLAGASSARRTITVERLGPLIRGRTTAFGQPKPAHTARIRLASTAPFKLQRVKG